MFDARVQERPKTFKDFHAGRLEMTARFFGGTEPPENVTQGRACALTETRITDGFWGFLFIIHTGSCSSTTNVPSSKRARTGDRPAMDCGKPTCRRTVPTSITSSSPFLNNPTSPLAANGAWIRTSYRPSRFRKEYGLSVQVIA